MQRATVENRIEAKEFIVASPLLLLEERSEREVGTWGATARGESGGESGKRRSADFDRRPVRKAQDNATPCLHRTGAYAGGGIKSRP